MTFPPSDPDERPSLLRGQRAAFDVPQDVAHFNTAKLSPMLHAVRAAGNEALERRSQPWTITAQDWFAGVERARGMFAQLVGGEPDGVALIPATSYGFAVAARNVEVSSGERILVLAEECPSGAYTWQAVARHTGAELLTVYKDAGRRDTGQTWTEAILAALDERVALVSVPNVHLTDGALIDLLAVAAMSSASDW
jgi:selenocysteine lyase/cysteine desulfurase